MATQADSAIPKYVPSLAEVIDQVGLGPTHLRFALTGGGVWFADGAELLLISALTSAVSEDWHLSPFQRGSMVTVVYIGVLVGNIISGPLGDRHGRRELILASYVGIFVFSMVSSFMQCYWLLCTWRFLVGMSFGLGQPPWSALAVEVTPSRWRVVVNTMSMGFFTLGEIYSSLLIMADDPTMLHLNWRNLLRWGALPSLLFWISASIFLEQSPFFLAQAGRHKEAEEVLAIMRRDNCLPEFSTNFCRQTSNEFAPQTSAEEPSDGFMARFQKLRSGPLLSTTIIMSYTCFAMNLVYYGGLYAFPNILPTLHAGGNATSTSAASQLLIGALWEIPGVAIAIISGLYIPRRPVLKISCLLTVCGLVLFATGVEGGDHWFPVAAWHVGYYLFKFVVYAGFVMAYVYISEVYPTNVRVTGAAINFSLGRLGAIVSPLIYEQLYYWTGYFTAFFYMLAAIMLVNVVLLDFLQIETFCVALTETTDELEASKDSVNEYGAMQDAAPVK